MLESDDGRYCLRRYRGGIRFEIDTHKTIMSPKPSPYSPEIPEPEPKPDTRPKPQPPPDENPPSTPYPEEPLPPPSPEVPVIR
jgi:hypothetical protein